MYVPVDERDALHIMVFLREARRDGAVVEHAKSKTTLRFGVMADWPHQGVSVLDLPGQHSLGSDEHTTTGKCRDFEAPRAKGSVPVGSIHARVAAGAGTHLLDGFDILASMHT